jgi:hypothetical protein
MLAATEWTDVVMKLTKTRNAPVIPLHALVQSKRPGRVLPSRHPVRGRSRGLPLHPPIECRAAAGGPPDCVVLPLPGCSRRGGNRITSFIHIILASAELILKLVQMLPNSF